MNYLMKRIENIRAAIAGKADAILVTDNITRRYCFNFASSAGFGYISRNKCELYLDFRYYEKACIARKEGKISSAVTIREISSTRKDILLQLLADDKAASMMYEDSRMTCSEFAALSEGLANVCELVPAGKTTEKLRAVKDEYELERIVEAQRITDLAFSHIAGYIKRGMREKDIALELEYFMRRNGADGLAFDTICVSGRKSSMPHGEPDDTIVGDGFLTLDFGASFDGYCSDMTRTLCIGKPDEEMKRIYETVLDAQNAAFSVICSGVVGSEVDKAARDLINSAGYEGCFGHSTGHSLGLEIHESPNFSSRESAQIPGGAVLSVEPGIYISGKCGVRIEDIVFLTENGYKNLTNSTKDIIIIQ